MNQRSTGVTRLGGWPPKEFKIDIEQMFRDKVVSKIRSVFGDDQ